MLSLEKQVDGCYDGCPERRDDRGDATAPGGGGFWEVCRLIPAHFVIAGEVNCSQQAKTTLRPPANVPVILTGSPPLPKAF